MLPSCTQRKKLAGVCTLKLQWQHLILIDMDDILEIMIYYIILSLNCMLWNWGSTQKCNDLQK